MWSLYLSIGGVILFGGLAVIFWRRSAATERDLGKARAKRDELEHEIRRLRGALLAQGAMVKELGRPDPTPGVLADVLRGEAADDEPGAA